jgi:hypothetical protein
VGEVVWERVLSVSATLSPMSEREARSPNVSFVYVGRKELHVACRQRALKHRFRYSGTHVL